MAARKGAARGHARPRSRRPPNHGPDREVELELRPRSHESEDSRREDWRVGCPSCGANALVFTRKPGRDDGIQRVLVYCHGCEARLDEVSAASAIPKTRLLTWPPPDDLGPRLARSSHRVGPPQAPPSPAFIAGSVEYLLTNPRAKAARAHARRIRRMSEAGLRWGEVGYGKSYFQGCLRAFMFAVRDEHGCLVGYKERYWPQLWTPPGAEPVRYRALSGTSWVYPLRALAQNPGDVIVAEGEWDCLALNELGLAAITSTAGKNWKPEWNRYLDGRRVGVVYDADAVDVAHARVDGFHEAGIAAYVIDLTRAGLSGKDGVNEFLRKRSADDFRELVETSRSGRRRGGRTTR
jgi:hypothetical protein